MFKWLYLIVELLKFRFTSPTLDHVVWIPLSLRFDDVLFTHICCCATLAALPPRLYLLYDTFSASAADFYSMRYALRA